MNSKPRLLDLFCGAGGAATGYHRAGFEVVGVDIKPQPNYPFEFLQQDALGIQTRILLGSGCWDAIHASPPCQAYIRGGLQREGHPDLLPSTRELLKNGGPPWVIENVPGAPMRADAVLCGSMFGLPIRRHRWFELSWGEPLLTPACDHSRPIVGVYGNPHGKAGAWRGMLPGSYKSWSEALDIDWMTTAELAEAIPPAYTELIGHQLMQHVRERTPNCGCREDVLKRLRVMGVEAHVTHAAPLLPSPYEDLAMTCPHGVTWHTAPTSEQIAKWAEAKVE